MNNFQNVTLGLHHKLWFFLFLVFPLVTSAQTTTAVNDTIVYQSTGIDKKPECPGGVEKFYKYISENYKLPTDKEFTGGKVITSFIVEKNGSLTNIKIIRDLGFGTGAEAVRVLKTSPAWIPGEIKGLKVRVQYYLPLVLKNSPTPVVTEPKEESILDADKVEVKPSFSGGLKNFYKFIGANFRSPDIPGFKGKLIVSFIVGIDGTLSNFKMIKDIGHGTGDEIIRVLKLSPKWTPAIQNGKEVRSTYVLPITIDTPKD